MDDSSLPGGDSGEPSSLAASPSSGVEFQSESVHPPGCRHAFNLMLWEVMSTEFRCAEDYSHNSAVAFTVSDVKVAPSQPSVCYITASVHEGIRNYGQRRSDFKSTHSRDFYWDTHEEFASEAAMVDEMRGRMTVLAQQFRDYLQEHVVDERARVALGFERRDG